MDGTSSHDGKAFPIYPRNQSLASRYSWVHLPTGGSTFRASASKEVVMAPPVAISSSAFQTVWNVRYSLPFHQPIRRSEKRDW